MTPAQEQAIQKVMGNLVELLQTIPDQLPECFRLVSASIDELKASGLIDPQTGKVGQEQVICQSCGKFSDDIQEAFGIHKAVKPPADPCSKALGNLLARIHRDGGHYQAEHGTEKACIDAETKFNEIRQVIAERPPCDKLRAAAQAVTNEWEECTFSSYSIKALRTALDELEGKDAE